MALIAHHKTLLSEVGLAYAPTYLESVAATFSPKEYLFKKIEAQTNSYGQSVVALETIKKDERIFKFCGEIKNFEAYCFAERPYLIPIGNFRWLNPIGIPRYVNHSCEPNCTIRNKTELHALREIKKGEELTFRYDVISSSEDETSASFLDECRWDQAFTFTCMCGTPSCVGVVDKNLVFERTLDVRKPASKAKKRHVASVA